MELPEQEAASVDIQPGLKHTSLCFSSRSIFSTARGVSREFVVNKIIGRHLAFY